VGYGSFRRGWVSEGYKHVSAIHDISKKYNKAIVTSEVDSCLARPRHERQDPIRFWVGDGWAQLVNDGGIGLVPAQQHNSYTMRIICFQMIAH
jgi:hypothetical protein